MIDLSLKSILALAAISGAAVAQSPQGTPILPPVSEQLSDPKSANVAILGHVVEPAQLKPTQERMGNLSLPEGFSIKVFAEDLINPRMIDVADDGTVYVTRRSVGDVMMLRDEDGDGRADIQQTVASRPQMHGIEIDGDTMYLTTVADVFRTTRNADGTLAPLERIISDLPAGGQHPNRMVVKGPDDMLYISVGSTCNACGETDPENATMVRATPDGSSRSIFATGLRNTIGYAFEPDTGALFGMDHGIDWLGDNEQHEELNRIEEGRGYGWPYVYGANRPNPQDYPPGGISMEEWQAQSTDPVGLYTPHAAPMQLTFYTGDAFPEAYRGDAFVAMRGSWNRKSPSGYEVLRIEFEDGAPVRFTPFVTGFLMEDGESDTGWGHMGRLAGIAEGPDGTLYLSDDTNGVIYRISYDGDSEQEEASAPLEPTNAENTEVGMREGTESTDKPEKQAGLASDQVAGSVGPIDVHSSAFKNGAPIPDLHAAEGQNVSPPLNWADGPDGTQSYALIVDDPDAPVETPPFIHWVLYNIPAGVTSLREGVPGAARLDQPEGAMQGPNDHGSTGYFGPRPPAGDPAHTYHFQVFALDRVLDLPHGATRQQLINAMEGHVLSVGVLTGTYLRPEAADN